ncbi:MAG TPA: CoA transferase [Acidimicrobiia bacterium]|jgi:crotonobetainyl-CoA:carnitine CoA-transferase CaiB-like acyl-CoA transferase|nr:CoA transferase [Acidimicrobiia bacterium]
MSSALDGIRVLDFSSGVAGPVAAMLLADHGADVVKIEPPGGDPLRGTPGYATWLRGRRSAVLDLQDPADRETCLALVRDADVVLESFSPGVTARLGIDFETLQAENARLVHCSITAYGANTSFRDRPGYDALVAARCGTLHEQRGHLGGAMTHMNREEPYLPDLEIPEGMEPGSPRNGPIFTYTPWLSFYAALNATLGISAALLAREHTGRGQHVETSLLQSAFLATASKWMRAENSDTRRFRTWVYERRATKGMFQCSDGRWVQQWVPNPAFVLSSAAGDTLELRRDVDRQRDDPDRIDSDLENIIVLAHYFPLMADAFRQFPSAEWTRVAAEAGVPLQPVRTPEEALTDPALEAEGAVADVPHPDHGTLRQMGILYGLSETPGAIGRPVPRVGEHTDEVRAEAATAATGSDLDSTADTEALRAPLDGVTVLDLGFAVAGPFGTQLLADLGANVIKVNALRDPFWQQNHIAYGCNRGKRSIGIDLKTAEGLAVLHRLVERADVVHSNMRRDALHRLKIDEASLREINPSLIYVHTRGFDRGPRSDSPGNDQTGCSLAGVTYEDGGCHDGGRPFWGLTSLGDTGNGFLSAIGVLQALYHRKRTGVAQSVDTSILNAGLLCASMASLRPDGTPLPRPQLDGMQLGLSPRYRLYETSDGWVCLAALSAEDRAALAAALGVADLPADDELTDVLEPWFASRTASDAFATLDGHRVPCEIADGDFGVRVHDDPEMQALGLVVKQQHPKLGRFEHFGVTLEFSDTPQRIFGPPPVVGQHTREIMHDYGYDDADVDKLLESKAVFEELWYE